MGVGYKDLLNAKDTGSSRSVRDIVVKYLYHTPLFLASIVVCFALGFLYIRNTEPKYIATTTILIKTNKLTNNAGADKNLTGSLAGDDGIDIDNDLKKLHSSQLITDVVTSGQYNISYKIIGKIRQSEVYKDAPFFIDSMIVKDSNNIKQFSIGNMDGAGFEVQEESQNDAKPVKAKWHELITIGNSRFSLAPKQSSFNGDPKYMVEWSPVAVTVNNILNDFSVQSPPSRTSMELSLLNANLEKGKDIVNAIAKEFREANMREIDSVVKRINDVTRTNKRIIEDTTKGINKSVSENNIGSLNQSAQASQLQVELKKKLYDLDNERQGLKKLSDAINTRPDQPITIGPLLNNLGSELSATAKKFNDALANEKSLSNVLGPNATNLKKVRDEIADTRNLITSTLNQLIIQTDLDISNNNQQLNEVNRQLLGQPEKEFKNKEIERKADQSFGLSTELFKNQMNIVFALVSLESNYKQLDTATGYGPVQPNKTTIYKFALLAGLLIPFAFIYLRDLLNDKITSREDIMKRTAIPILGEISHIRKFNSQHLPALQPGLTGEQFRIIRSNLALLQKGKEHTVVLVTSTTSAEGKSFISLNLAAVMAKSGKKIALLEFDLRKPHDENLGVNESKGLTDYLSGNATLSDIGHPLEQLPNLHIYPAGYFIDEPADILMDEKIPSLFSQLREQYDLIIINSAPAGLVSDPITLGQYADIVLYVVRQRRSHKKHLDFVDDLSRTNKLNNVCILFNDVRTGVKQGYKGYGYVKGSPYYKSWKNAKGKSAASGEIQSAADV